MARRDFQRGFTLVELVIVIAITGIVAVVGAVLIQGTVGGYVDQERRAGLVTDADRALRRMSREIRTALPNSLRVNGCGGTPCVEFLATVAGGRYREGPGPAPVGGNPDRRLQFNQADGSFNSTGPVGKEGNGQNYYLSVYNTGQTGNSAWVGQSMTPTRAATVTDDGAVPGESRVTVTPPHQFPLSSPRQRFYLVNEAVAFVCENGQMNRYGYDRDQPYNANSGNPLTGSVDSCTFTYDAGTSTRAGLLTMTLVLEEEGEQVRLQHQIQVNNSP